jgi:hypothetical protein
VCEKQLACCMPMIAHTDFQKTNHACEPAVHATAHGRLECSMERSARKLSHAVRGCRRTGCVTRRQLGSCSTLLDQFTCHQSPLDGTRGIVVPRQVVPRKVEVSGRGAARKHGIDEPQALKVLVLLSAPVHGEVDVIEDHTVPWWWWWWCRVVVAMHRKDMQMRVVSKDNTRKNEREIKPRKRNDSRRSRTVLT